MNGRAQPYVTPAGVAQTIVIGLDPASPDLSQELMAAAGGRAGRFLDVDFGPGV